MKPMLKAVVGVTLGALSAAMLWGQMPPADSGVTIRTGVNEVALDLTVRDDRGRLVKDLKPADVEIYEDGVRQRLVSLRLVSGREAQEKKKGGESKSLAAPHQPYALRPANLICLVYHNIPRNANLLKNVADMTHQLLALPLQPDTYIGVFRMDSHLVTLYPFTHNREQLQQAARNLFAGPPPAGVDEASVGKLPAPATDGRGVVGALAGMVAASSGASGVGNTPTAAAVNAGSVEATARQQMDQLTAMVQELAAIEGRKTVLLVSPGVVNSRQPEILQGVLDKARAARLTVYSIDANGASTAGVNNDALNSMAAVSASQTNPNLTAQANMANMRAEDDLQALVRSSDMQAPLRELAEGTGGRLIATLDVKKPFQRVLDDVAMHYVATYRPTSEKMDGHFRAIEVKLARSGLTVDTRKGYFAVPGLGEAATAAAFEDAPLAALAAEPKPRAFGFEAAAYRFRPGETNAQYAIGFELPAGALAATPDPAQKNYRLRVSLLALVKDPNGQVVAKVSRDFPSRVTAQQLAAMKTNMMTYTQAIELPPGKYTVEAAAVDAESGRATTDVFPLDNEPGKTGLGLSDVVLVQAMEPQADTDLADPFQLKHGRVVPELVPKLTAHAKPSVYFVVYPEKGKDKARFAAKVLRDGQVIADQTGALPAPDASGAIRMVIRLAPQPGEYEVQVTAIEGSESVERSLHFSVAP